MNFANNEEADPPGIKMKEEIETDDEAGIKIISFSIYKTLFLLYVIKF